MSGETGAEENKWPNFDGIFGDAWDDYCSCISFSAVTRYKIGNTKGPLLIQSFKGQAKDVWKLQGEEWG